MGSAEPGNVCAHATAGCHVAFAPGALHVLQTLTPAASAPPPESPPSWIDDCGPFDPEDFGLPPFKGEDDDGSALSDHVPDISIDPDSGLLSVINASLAVRSYFITLGHPASTADGESLATGLARDEAGSEAPVISLVLVVGPRETMDACYVDVDSRLGAGAAARDPDAPDSAGAATAGVELYSDIKDVPLHPSPRDLDPAHVVAFPLGDVPPTGFRCSQGCGGAFTHFYRGTLHAVDLECPLGTPVLAVGDGEVVEVQQDHAVGGVHAKNLFLWNSVSIKLDGSGLVVEYVHIAAGSCTVKTGDRVAKGQRLCASGDVGFCPTPHLHIQAHLTADADAPTVQFAFERVTMRDDHSSGASGPGDGWYVPVAGGFYGTDGPVL